MVEHISGAAQGGEAIAESNASAYDREAEGYAEISALQMAELAILRRFRGRWDDMSVLDIGVGAGRTAYTLAAIAGTYVGLDYSPRMVELARATVREDERTVFHVADARDLSFLGDRRFDLVLFSFNGIDYVEHQDRLRILDEIRRVTSPEGWFAFSSHSLAALPFQAPPLRLPSRRAPLRSVLDLRDGLRRARLIRRINRAVDLPAAMERGWALIRDEHQSIVTYYVTPATQRHQIENAGFELVEAFDRTGQTVDPAHPGRDVWIYYLCRPVNRPDA